MCVERDFCKIYKSHIFIERHMILYHIKWWLGSGLQDAMWFEVTQNRVQRQVSFRTSLKPSASPACDVAFPSSGRKM
jgi:hypothetical protein